MECVIEFLLVIVGGNVGLVLVVEWLEDLLLLMLVFLCCECLCCVFGVMVDDVEVVCIFMVLGM